MATWFADPGSKHELRVIKTGSKIKMCSTLRISPNYLFQRPPHAKVKWLLLTPTEGCFGERNAACDMFTNPISKCTPYPAKHSYLLKSFLPLRLLSTALYTVPSLYNMHAAFSTIQEDYIQMPPCRSDHINSDLSIILCGCCFALGIIIIIPHLSYSTSTASPRKLL